MNEDTKALLIVSIKNSITLICFVILAVVFNHWWLALISALFFSDFDNKIKTNEESEAE